MSFRPMRHHAGMARQVTSIAAVIALLSAASAPGAAQDEMRDGEAQDETRDSEARGLFDAGVSAYGGGRYEEALGYFQRAYDLSERPVLLYNIGTAAERARRDEVALRAYEQYLERVPDAANRARVETRITALRALVSAEPASAGEAPVLASAGEAPVLASAGEDFVAIDVEAPVEVSAGSGDAGVAPWIVLAGGAAVMVVGGVLLGVGLADQATVENPPPGASWEDSAAAYDRGPALLTSGAVLLPVGVAIAAVGLVWGVAGTSGGSGEVALRVGPSSVQVEGRF